ncbi:uncharacterized protein DUF4190 [Leucobacter luti]|uniref:Uncharacterized protein DUF4190 n=1 Tax=Leucobacter luti TaxID=340320 RepID=A0A4R6RZ42_9MICO|nr:DUF4190 domain-containing protein [Leucobacter luti]TDP92400.1 uncharacterized protein DUF4190 [Leucobacter luti]
MSYPAPQPPASQPQPPHFAHPQPTAFTPAPAKNTNTLAIIALVSSFFISLAGVICGHIALKQIADSGEGGRGMALAGTIIGYVGLVLGLVWLIIVFAMLGAASTASYSTY